MNNITNKFSSFKDGVLNKFIPKWSCSHQHIEQVNDTIYCKVADCDQTIWDSKESFKVWLNLTLAISVIAIISVPVGGVTLFVYLKQEIKHKESVIGKKENTIQQLKGSIKSKDQQLKAKQKTIETKDIEIKKQQGVINNKNKKIQTQQGVINNKNKQIKKQQGIINTKNKEILRLKIK
jgi:hypothetical protein